MNPHSVIYDYSYSLLISFVVSKGLDVTKKFFLKMIKFISVVLILFDLVICEPQLDIPGITEAPPQKGLRVVVLPNSYANDEHEDEENQPKSEANTQFDSDRSQRYGSEILM